jgi:hypothetical protein
MRPAVSLKPPDSRGRTAALRGNPAIKRATSRCASLHHGQCVKLQWPLDTQVVCPLTALLQEDFKVQWRMHSQWRMQYYFNHSWPSNASPAHQQAPGKGTVPKHAQQQQGSPVQDDFRPILIIYQRTAYPAVCAACAQAGTAYLYPSSIASYCLHCQINMRVQTPENRTKANGSITHMILSAN